MKMKKILNIESPRDHYLSKATVIWCFDDRFSEALEKFLAMTPEYQFDVVKIAGGVKQISSPENESDRDFILRQVAASIKLHKSEKVVLMAHTECGAYGGKIDVQFYVNELEEGEKTLRNFLHVDVVKLFVDFDGIYRLL